MAHESRLPRAVNADKRHDDVGWHGERQVGERFNVLPIRPHEGFRETARRDDRSEISHEKHLQAQRAAAEAAEGGVSGT